MRRLALLVDWLRWEWPMVALLVVIGGALLFVVGAVTDISLGSSSELRGVVIDKAYSAATSGTGYAGGQGGGVVVVSSPEKWVLLIDSPEHGVVSRKVNAETWARFEKGDEIVLAVRVGRFTGYAY